MVEEDPKLRPDSVWGQFHSPVLENATVIDFERMNPQDEARQVEIRKVRQSIDEMSILLAEMQEMYHPPDTGLSPVEGSSPSEAYVTAFDQTNSPNSSTVEPVVLNRKPSLAFGMLTDNPRGSTTTQMEHLEGPQRKLRIDNTTTRDSMRASVISGDNPTKAPELASGSASNKRRSVSTATPHRLKHESTQRETPQGNHRHRTVSQPQPLPKDTNHHHNHHHHHKREASRDSRSHSHPKGHALHHVQQNKHPRSTVANSVQPNTRRSSARTQFTQENITEQLNNTNELSIESLDLPPSERKLLERFITTLSKLSIEIQMDDAKRQEGRRRMNNALRALEGWI